MTPQEVMLALDLPASCRVDQRVPKKLLVENGAPTAADKRLINESIGEIHWLAALKPATAGVPDFRDAAREYLEIAVLSVALRAETKAGRLAELVHRAVPYPVFLILAWGSCLNLSLAHKRWAQNEAGKTVLDGGIAEVTLASDSAPIAHEARFMQALAMGHQPRSTLYALYQGWIDTLEALRAARLSGTFVTVSTPEQAAARRQALHDCQRLEAEAARLSAAAAKEKQLARQVALNLELKRVRAEQAQTREKL